MANHADDYEFWIKRTDIVHSNLRKARTDYEEKKLISFHTTSRVSSIESQSLASTGHTQVSGQRCDSQGN